MTKRDLLHLTTDIEMFLQDMDKVVVDKIITLKDIAVVIAYPLYRTGINEDFVIKFKEDKRVIGGIVNVSGNYLSEGTIVIEYNPEDKEYVWNKVLWTFVKGMIFDTLSHEVVHWYQFQKRMGPPCCPWQRIPSKKEYKCLYRCLTNIEHEDCLYIIKPDEVEAYSYNAASQLFRKYRSVDAALNTLRVCKWEDAPEAITLITPCIKRNSYMFKRYLKKIVFYLMNKYSEETYKSLECNNENNK